MSPSHLKASPSMTCEELAAFREAFVDGEIADGEPGQLEIESHLAGCPACREAVTAGRAWRRRMREVATEGDGSQAPDRLRASIVAGLADARRHRRRARLRPVLGWSALIACAATAAVLLVRTSLTRERTSSLITASVDNHHRALPMEVEDPQLPRIRSWFQGKVDFAPSRIPELRKVNLIGARLSNVSQHRAAYVAYGSGNRRVSLFVFDAPNLQVPNGRQINNRDVLIANEHGYNVALWKDQEIVYSLVSDLDEGDVLELIGATTTH